MATVAPPLPSGKDSLAGSHAQLSRELRRLTRLATAVAVLTSPTVFWWLHHHDRWSVLKSLLVTFALIVLFRGLVEVLVRHVIPWPSLFGTDDARLREEDVTNRRRSWTWRWFFRLCLWIGGLVTVFYVAQIEFAHPGSHITWVGTGTVVFHKLGHLIHDPTALIYVFQIFFLFFANFLIFMGPLLLMGISQIRGYEPGDAEWGVKLDHVRGQAEAKEAIRRVVTLWQSGEVFEGAGGKRERGLLFLGAPGTGKTMMAKAIATGFNSPFVSIPGSGFAQTFIGIDAVIVRFLARKAKRLARKWGGECIVFIDEIDAVGMRRRSLGTSPSAERPEFYGPWGSEVPGGDLFIETREWREWLFHQRAEEPTSPYPSWYRMLAQKVNQGIFPGLGGMGMGGMALNQLLVVMDGIDNPPFMRRMFTSRVNSFLDAIFVVPVRVGRFKLRLPPPRPTGAQIYFIGATNVPLEALDPALTRPGRMGRHVMFRTPTKEDRQDIFDLYLGKVAHDPELDSDERRDEIARITTGYSPAMIDQICSMALTNAHHEGRAAFNWSDLLDAMTVIEAGAAIGIEPPPDQLRATAIHEAGHAVLSHLYDDKHESARLSVRMRGSSLGHHSAREKEEQFSLWQSDARASLLHILGAMAAEHVFYGQNTSGVSMDLRMATGRAAAMVDFWGMAPVLPKLNGQRFDDESEDETIHRIQRRFGDLGNRILSTWGGDNVPGPKRPLVAQFLGEAFATAYNAIRLNREGVERVADAVLEEKEIYGNALLKLLNDQNLKVPEIDWTKEEFWPQIVLWSRDERPRGRERDEDDDRDRRSGSVPSGGSGAAGEAEPGVST